MRNRTIIGALAGFLAMAGAKAQQSEPPRTTPQDSATHHEGVTGRGDHAMGFSHEKTTHHFRLYKNGGAIEVSANDAKDADSVGQIRMHLSHVAKLFAAGDFNVPMFIHDTFPPGAATMSKLRQQIHYIYQDADRGGRIRISTENAEALDAVHAFLRFQITDHETGDSLKTARE